MAWESKFNTDYWQGYSGYAQWVTDHWASDNLAGEILLNEVGTWVEGYRPATCRITINSPSSITGTLNIVVYDATFNPVGQSLYNTAPSGSSQWEINLTFSSSDIYLLDIYDSNYAVDFTITNIEFGTAVTSTSTTSTTTTTTTRPTGLTDTAYIRFTNVNVPKWAKLRAVYVKFRAFENELPVDCNSYIYFTTEANPSAPANKAAVDAYPRSIGIGWKNIDKWVDDYYYRTPNLASILQPNINLDDWAPNNSVLVLFEEDGSASGSHRMFSAGEYVGGQERPTLEVHYTPPPTLRAPEIEPEEGVYFDEVRVSMVAYPSAAQIRYTVDGTDPTEASPLYVNPFTIISNTVVKAKAFLDYWTESPITTHTYTLKHIYIRRPGKMKDCRSYHFVAQQDGTITNFDFGSSGVFFEDYDGEEKIGSWVNFSSVWTAPKLSVRLAHQLYSPSYNPYGDIGPHVDVTTFILRIPNIPIDISTPFTAASLRLLSFFPDSTLITPGSIPTENYFGNVEGIEWHWSQESAWQGGVYTPEPVYGAEMCGDGQEGSDLLVYSTAYGHARNDPKLYAIDTDNFTDNDFPTTSAGLLALSTTTASVPFTPIRPLRMMRGKYTICKYDCSYWDDYYNYTTGFNYAHPRFYSINLKPILTEIINRPGWVKNNSIALVVKFDSYGPYWIKNYEDWLDGRTPGTDMEAAYYQYAHNLASRCYFGHGFCPKVSDDPFSGYNQFDPYASCQPTLKIYSEDSLPTTTSTTTTTSTMTTTAPIMDLFEDDCSGGSIDDKWIVTKAGAADAYYSSGSMYFYTSLGTGADWQSGVNVTLRRELQFVKRKWRFAFNFKASQTAYMTKFLLQLVASRWSPLYGVQNRHSWYYHQRDTHVGHTYWIGLQLYPHDNVMAVIRSPWWTEIPGGGGHNNYIQTVSQVFSSTTYSRIRFETDFDTNAYAVYVDDVLKMSGVWYNTWASAIEYDNSTNYGVNFHFHRDFSGYASANATIDDILFTNKTTSTTTSTTSSTMTTVTWVLSSSTTTTSSTSSTTSTTRSTATTTSTYAPVESFYDAAAANGIGTKWYSYVGGTGYTGWQSAGGGYYYLGVSSTSGGANLVTADTFVRSGRWKFRYQTNASYYSNYHNFELVPQDPVYTNTTKKFCEYGVGTDTKLFVRVGKYYVDSNDAIYIIERIDGTETILTSGTGQFPSSTLNLEFIVDFDNHLVEVLLDGVRRGSRVTFSSTIDSRFGDLFKVNLHYSHFEAGSYNSSYKLLDFDRYEGTSTTTTSTTTSTTSSSTTTTTTAP